MENIIALMQQVVEQESQQRCSNELGIVTEVFPHAEENDKQYYHCSVQLKNRKQHNGELVELKSVAVMTPYIGLTCIPNVGDLVLINFIEGNIHAPIIVGRLYNDQHRPPLNKKNEFQIQHSKKDGDTIESGGTIKIDADGEITLSSKNGEILLVVNDEKIALSNDKMNLTMDFSDDKISLVSNKDLELKAPNGDLLIEAKQINMKSSSGMELESGSSTDIKAAAAMTLKGASVDIN